MNVDLGDLLYAEEEKMYVDDDEFKTQLIENLEKELVNFCHF